jgi:hypothetical protein
VAIFQRLVQGKSRLNLEARVFSSFFKTSPLALFLLYPHHGIFVAELYFG